MIQKFKNSLFVLVTLLTGALPVLVPASVYAAAGGGDNISGAICSGTKIAADSTTLTSSNDQSCATGADGASVDGLYGLAKNVVNIFSVIVGIIAVIMIIFGGFKYITSGGDSGNVSGAKNTLIYAIVGLIIVALAQFIVHFVLKTANSAANPGA